MVASVDVKELKSSIHQFILGQEHLVQESLCCLLAGGHILMTGAPGLAKTTLVRVLAAHLGLEFKRIQFTPDLMPSDIIGTEILNLDEATNKRSFEFHKGPVFTNLLLADEINRASPRTQSALLEAMSEGRVTVRGKTYELPKPFMVLATQNPYESEGTFPLPEAQLDRFLLHSLVQYPDEGSEKKILEKFHQGTLVDENKLQSLDKKVSKEDLIKLIEDCKAVQVEPEYISGILDLVKASRPQDLSVDSENRSLLEYGAGPRAGISLIACAKANALLSGRNAIGWEDIQAILQPVLRHRIRLSSKALRSGMDEDKVLVQILQSMKSKYADLVSGLGG